MLLSNVVSSSIGRNCVIVGAGCKSLHDDCLLVGDSLATSEDGQVIVGNTLSGNLIPDSVKTMIEENAEAIRWLMRNLR